MFSYHVYHKVIKSYYIEKRPLTIRNKNGKGKYPRSNLPWKSILYIDSTMLVIFHGHYFCLMPAKKHSLIMFFHVIEIS